MLDGLCAQTQHLPRRDSKQYSIPLTPPLTHTRTQHTNNKYTHTQQQLHTGKYCYNVALSAQTPVATEGDYKKYSIPTSAFGCAAGVLEGASDLNFKPKQQVRAQGFTHTNIYMHVLLCDVYRGEGGCARRAGGRQRSQFRAAGERARGFTTVLCKPRELHACMAFLGVVIPLLESRSARHNCIQHNSTQNTHHKTQHTQTHTGQLLRRRPQARALMRQQPTPWLGSARSGSAPQPMSQLG